MERSLAAYPHTFTLRGRGGTSLTLGNGSLHWHNTGGAHTLFDPRANTFRPAGIQDIRDSTRLLDALESVDEVIPFFTPQDVPAPLADRRLYDEWDRSGRDGMVERAQAKAERILQGHEVPPLSSEQDRELDRIMCAAERELVG